MLQDGRQMLAGERLVSHANKGACPDNQMIHPSLTLFRCSNEPSLYYLSRQQEMIDLESVMPTEEPLCSHAYKAKYKLFWLLEFKADHML
ncbi:unnamed protein product [Triticum turgidum subsp. durum]|uniref:Uncharacterized protein n=2 Tax=Triticum TaxID=4564 RepID=A0A8R7QBV1_TRIUA|nr:unnamed protein product [Triticum turgidum subsp. durum]